MRITISRSVLDGIESVSAQAAPNEACGLLFGSAGLIEDWQAVENVAEHPMRHFEIAPAALFAALRAERAGGPRIAGYWHSHPSGHASPSATDAAVAQPDGKLWLIVGGAQVTAWRAVADGAVHGRFETVTIDAA